jgi:hypothetical protein
MNLDDIQGASLAMHYLEALASEPAGAALFIRTIKVVQPEAWAAWAENHGRLPDDPALVQDVLLAALAACIEGNRVCLEKHAAIFEAQQIIDGGSEVV